MQIIIQLDVLNENETDCDVADMLELIANAICSTSGHRRDGVICNDTDGAVRASWHLAGID